MKSVCETGFVVLSLLFLSGCVVIQSSQLNNLMKIFDEPPLDISANSWFLRYSDYESIVYAIDAQDGTLFSNSAGDYILFDGWKIAEIGDIGNYKTAMKIRDSGLTRSFVRSNRILANHKCAPWIREENARITRFSQNCNDKMIYANSILVSEDGHISLIRQIVDERYTALTLTKLKYGGQTK